MRKATRRLAWALAAALIFVGAVSIALDRRYGDWRAWDFAIYEAHLLYLHYVPPLTWPRDTFSPEAWKQAPDGERYRLAKSLLGSGQLKGRTPAEVNKLLGGMRGDHSSCLEQVGVNDTECYYPLRKVGFESLWWVLMVDFKNGRVSDARRDMGFLDQ